MSRILLLVLFVVWMAGPPPQPTHELWPNLALFFSFYLLLVILLGLWSRALARRVAAQNFHRSVRRFNHVMFAARVMVPVWFTVGVWVLGWGGLVAVLGTTMYKSVVGMLLGTMPAFATWMGLWWSQYPAERALREQNLLVELDNDLPLYRPPAFRSYFLSNLRLQVLFTLIPVAMIVLIKDALMWTVLWASNRDINSDAQVVEMICTLISAATVFVFAPLLLCRVLNTTPMADTPLKRKLDAMCQRAGVRYRHILVWNTHNHVGNAAVMGVFPWVRYVLLSDVLLEQMNEREIQAVFAHELGHVVYRHMTWYAVFMVALATMMMVLMLLGRSFIESHLNITVEAITSPIAVAGFVLFFGALSRRCERQADVYAARTMELLNDESSAPKEELIAPLQLATVGAGPLAPPRTVRETAVGRYGADVFALALSRVATINNIPITPRVRSLPGLWNHIAHVFEAFIELANNWLHGSISSRMKYLEDLSTDPRRTMHFDRIMFWIYFAIVFVLVMSIISLIALPSTTWNSINFAS